MSSTFFFFTDTATTEIYTLSLHDALPISARADDAPPHDRTVRELPQDYGPDRLRARQLRSGREVADERSEEHTSELQSQSNLVCRLLLEKKKKKKISRSISTIKARDSIRK